MALALTGSNDGLWHWNLLTDAVHISPRVHELLDYAAGELGARFESFLDLVHDEDREAARRPLAVCLMRCRPYDAQFRMRLKSGEYRWFRVRGQVEWNGGHRPVHMAGSISDITDRKAAEAAVNRQALQQGLIAELGQLALNNPSLGELMSHAAAVITRGLTAECCRLLIADGDDLNLRLMGGSGWMEEWLARSFDPVEETEDRFIVGVREAVIIDDFPSETRFRPSAILAAHEIRSGAEMLICGAHDAYGILGIYSREPRQFTWENVNFLRGITNILASSMDRKFTDERLTYMAQFDGLTGLPNRNAFLDRLWHIISQADQDRRHAGVIFVDLDRFKLVNDTLGHGAGDTLLLEAAQRLSSSVRSDDMVGRLGGDEFAVALSNLAKPADAEIISQKILNAFSRPFQLAGQVIYVSASLGIGVYPTDGSDPDTLLKNADTAMYRAKEKGRNTYEFYLPQLKERAVGRLKIEAELRGALARGEFVLHYQPKVGIESGEISGFEALLRWQHCERGLISPAEFIPILEDTGMILPVGEWVVSTVCLQLQAWRAAGLPRIPVAVNLSPRQFAQVDLDSVIGATLRSTGVNPGLLEFELTESMLMTDSEASVRILKNLKSFGIRLSVDDFGTGYSSLAYLKRFPLDSLKIDRAFIRDVTSDSDGATIVLAIINLAHSLKLHVVAEGVETEAQFQFLRQHGCDEMQGFYVARPQPAHECTRALAEGWAPRNVGAVQRLARTA